jgi:hypothetical protein
LEDGGWMGGVFAGSGYGREEGDTVLQMRSEGEEARS